ncbi:aldo/keto reductase [Maritimibacter sp. DP1N21-5]|uniref:aldo/keto reductase n=1 Tax=Maritimibacter sp. DP1N21-5 TaxID=2836867 RepID=UPI001C43FB2E|nr:aldo/keto reductase [Maritimibacter sp. DP1N21-5]MBV7408010.1 aldo/keto reductase [Maritimibacter sp. DP1N21-5]
MKLRKLGKNGPKVSAIALGCMSFAGFYGKTDRDEGFATLDAARDAGITFLDTSDLYGQGLSEEWIGAYQADRGHRFQIATKGGIVAGAPRGTADNSEEYLRRHLDASLNRLGVDHVELYYVHRREFSRPIEEVTETLHKLKDEGLIGAIGFSEISPAALRRAASVGHVDAVQNEYSLWSRQPELGLIRACEELGTAFVPFSPLGRGILSDADLDPSRFGDTDFRKNNPRFQPDAFAANMRLVTALRDFAEARGWTTAAVAIAWTLQKSPVNIPIPGTRSADHLLDWADADEIIFSKSDWEELDRIMPAGWAEGDRYSDAQIVGIERYC